MLRFALLLAFLSLASSLELTLKLQNQWESFKASHKKSYQSAGEEEQRKDIFKRNVQSVLQHNLEVDMGKDAHRLGVNQFSDMTNEEFRKNFLGFEMRNNTRLSAPAPTATKLTAPMSRDWTPYLAPVKNQGGCGSCWTFATTGILEAYVAIYQGRRVVLSEQNLLDCASKNNYGNHGCDGGFQDYAFNYIIQNGGVDHAQCYGYETRENQCRFQRNCVGATMRNYVDLPSHDENALRETVGNVGPVTIGMDAMQDDLRMYAGGVYDSPTCSDTQLNHAVVIVGYGTENGKDYYLVRNSWGTGWGLGGYFKLARGRNRCGYSNTASYPIL